jgi:hypothetical protein
MTNAIVKLQRRRTRVIVRLAQNDYVERPWGCDVASRRSLTSHTS